VNTVRSFEADYDRYRFDFGHCTAARGFAQVDTSQDAWYYGTWANPHRLMIVSYAEGDVTIQTADTPEEFAAELRRIRAWNDEQGHEFLGIDPGFNDTLRARFCEIGLAELLH